MSAFGGKAAIERTCVDATVLLPLAAALSPHCHKSIIALSFFTSSLFAWYPSNGAIAMGATSIEAVQAPTPDSRLAPAPKQFIHRILPQAIITLGLGLTAAWVCFLGYGLLKLIGLVPA